MQNESLQEQIERFRAAGQSPVRSASRTKCTNVRPSPYDSPHSDGFTGFGSISGRAGTAEKARWSAHIELFIQERDSRAGRCDRRHEAGTIRVFLSEPRLIGQMENTAIERRESFKRLWRDLDQRLGSVWFSEPLTQQSWADAESLAGAFILLHASGLGARAEHFLLATTR